MIDIDKMREVIVSQLATYLNVPVIRSNTTGRLPDYPFVSYTIRTLLNNQGGTWGEYDDGKDRIPAEQIWSITIQSDACGQSLNLAVKAHDFFTRYGLQDLKDNGIVARAVSNVTNRDTIITVEYEYRNGFDVTFGFMNELDSTMEHVGYIDNVGLGNKEFEAQPTDEELAQRLADRLSGR